MTTINYTAHVYNDGKPRRKRGARVRADINIRNRERRQQDPERYRAYQRAWRKRNPGKIRAYQRNKSLLAKYGISLEHYDQLWIEQLGCCAICKEAESTINNGSLCELTVDHDHETGEIRGLLCSPCNAALGKFRDRLDLVEAAARYLRYAKGGGAS